NTRKPTYARECRLRSQPTGTASRYDATMTMISRSSSDPLRVTNFMRVPPCPALDGFNSRAVAQQRNRARALFGFSVGARREVDPRRAHHPRSERDQPGECRDRKPRDRISRQLTHDPDG